MQIYLDACCLNRPFDDQTQDRIRLESEAVLLILSRLQTGGWQWASSQILVFEIDQTPDAQRRYRVKNLVSYAATTIRIGESEVERALQWEALGFDAYDTLHLACAESARADIFLTTDDQLLRLAGRHSRELRLRVENPLTWLKEVMGR